MRRGPVTGAWQQESSELDALATKLCNINFSLARMAVWHTCLPCPCSQERLRSTEELNTLVNRQLLQVKRLWRHQLGRNRPPKLVPTARHPTIGLQPHLA